MKYNIVAEPLPQMPWKDRGPNDRGPLWRFSNNPVIGRDPVAGVERVFNSAVVPFNGEYRGVFRGDHYEGFLGLHLGRSRDGINWDIEENLLQFDASKLDDFPRSTASYDPRIVKLEDWWYVMWCNNNPSPTIGLARTQDFESFEQLENAFLPFNRNGVLFPRKIDGKFAMLSRPSDNGHTPFGDIWYSESPDLTHWGKHRFVMGAGSGNWQRTKIGPGPAPIGTSEGWLMLYHGVMNTCNGLVYRIGAALLDLDKPWKVIRRHPCFILGPAEDYETRGFVPNVTFPVACLCDGETGRLAIYYGAADTCTCLAFGLIDEILDLVLNYDSIQQ